MISVGDEVKLGERSGLVVTGIYLGEWDDGVLGSREWYWNLSDNSVVWRVPEIRECVAAQKGYRILSADYSQIEIKLMAFLSKDPNMLKALNARDASGNPTDIHCYISTMVYGERLKFTYEDMIVVIKEKAPGGKKHPRYKEFKRMRSNIKTTTFGVPYGSGAKGVAARCGITKEEAQQVIDDFFKQFPVLQKWLEDQGNRALTEYNTETPYHRKRFYDILRGMDEEGYDAERSQIRRWAGNHPIQACVSGSTRIFVEGDGYNSIVRHENQTISLWDGNRFVKATITAAGSKPLYRMKLANGLEIETSPDHKFLIATTHNKRQWHTLEELATKVSLPSRRNWRVVLTGEVPSWAYPLHIPTAIRGRAHNAKLVDLSTIANDKIALGEFLGRLASDGSCSLNKNGGSVSYLLVAEHEKYILPRLSEIASRISPIRVRTSRKRGKTKNGMDYAPVYRIELCSQSLVKQLIQIQVKARIPDFVWKDSVLLSSYIRGLYDGDGGVHPDGAALTWGCGDKHYQWAREVQEALLLFGIRSRMNVYPGEDGCIHLCIQKYDMPKFAERIGFMNPVKQAKAEAVKGTDFKGKAVYGQAIPIKSVVNTGLSVPMYDVVNSGTGQFMANGMVVHNSSADMLKEALRRIYSRIRGGILNGPRLYDARIIMVVHDEIVVMCADKDVEAVINIMKECMGEAYALIIGDVIPNEVDVSNELSWEKA